MVEEKGFFKEETIADLNNTLGGFKQEGYHWKVTQKIKLMSTHSERFLGYADRMTFGITREMAPIYVLGDPMPRSQIGKRGIAGTMEIKSSDLLQFYIDTPMRAIYEEIVGDENVQIILNDIEFMCQGESLRIEDIIHSEDDSWTFIAKTVMVKRMPTNNRGLAKTLLKKEWVPTWPDSVHSMEQI